MTNQPSLSQILANLEGMDLVAKQISAKFESESEKLSEIAQYLFSIGGKRLRPALTLLVAQAFSLNCSSPRLIDIAAGIELIHLGTLLHDDIIDRSPLRRKHTSPYAKYGACQTLLAGDFLLVRAFALCSQLDREIIEAAERACVNLTEGEITEGSLHEWVPTIEEYYYKIAAKKTAALFALGAFSAGHLAGLRSFESEHLRRFGEDLGIAFQILDDILDVTSDSDTLGKKPGTDIRERKPSIVNLMWLNSGDPAAKRLLTPPISDENSSKTNTSERSAVENEITEEAFIEESIAKLCSGESKQVILECREEAKRFALSARKHLHAAADSSSLTNPQYIKVLDTLINYTLTRVA